MNIFILYFLLFSSSFLSSFQFEILILEEQTPYNIIFSDLKGYYKIFKYIPFCGNKNIEQINLNIYLTTYHYIDLYIYDDKSKLEKEEINDVNPKFSNYQKHYIYYNYELRKISNLNCGKEYYFVFYEYYHYPIFFQFSIAKENDIIDISFLKGNLIIYRDANFFYSSKEAKYILINIYRAANLKIVEKCNGNEKIVENINIPRWFGDGYSNFIKLEKDKKYYMYLTKYEKGPIALQIYNELNIYKHNFNDGPIIISSIKGEYFYEIDISKYNIGDYIVFEYYGYDLYSNFKYRYKSSLSNYFTELGNYKGFALIPIVITKKDSSIILKLNMNYNRYGSDNIFVAVDLFKQHNYEEIISEYQKVIKGPKLLSLDYNKINNLNSMGVYSNQSYYIFEQVIDDTSNLGLYNNTYIVTRDYSSVNYKKIFIYFINDYSFLEIKKFDFPVYSINYQRVNYFNLCQGNAKEIYFYVQNDTFLPIFGNYDIYYINSNDVKTLSDLKFNKKLENNIDFSLNGYTKIVCDNPTMFRNINFKSYSFSNYNLTSGEKKYITPDFLKNGRAQLTLDISLVSKVIPLKFKALGLNNDQSISVYLDENEYFLNNTCPLEINYTYKNYLKDLIKFNINDNIKNIIYIEVIVGFLQEDLDSYLQIEFNSSLEEIDFSFYNGLIIKIPKNFNEELYDYSIIFDRSHECEVEISYDNIEYMVPRNQPNFFNRIFYDSISSFKSNPYNSISNNNDLYNKFFYILIKNNYVDFIASFKKPKIISNISFNKLNILSPLENENKNYFHQLQVPEGDYNYLIIQLINNDDSLKDIRMSIKKDVLEYHFNFNNSNYYSIFIDKSERIINIYETKEINYINIVPSKEYIYKEYKNYELNAMIKKVKNETKLKIKMNSFSHYYFPVKYKYYLILNIENVTVSKISSIISGYIKLEESNNQTIIIIEEEYERLNNIFQKEININISLSLNNIYKMTIVPTLKESNLIDFDSIKTNEFNYTDDYIDEDDSSKDDDVKKDKNKIFLFFICSISLGVSLMILVIFVITICCSRNINNLNKGNIEEDDLYGFSADKIK